MTNTPKIDGSYFLTFKNHLSYRSLNFGYYSNGMPMESLTKINIFKDTIIIKQEYNNNY